MLYKYKKTRKTKQNENKKNSIKNIYKQSKNTCSIQSERKRKQSITE